jgi:proteasome lid subunit RPN8/RPN11
MTGTAAAPQFETWSAPGHSFRIEYSAAVLDQIREIAVEGYHRVPHGGVETGGVLFGTHGKKMVRIAAWRPIECEYAKGPSFLLSEKDQAALAGMLQSWGDAEDLAGLEPVGWYRSHTRSEILLADVDLTFFNRFFPQPWQVGLIVRPASFAPARAGFFFREPGGGIRTESSYREFVMLPLPQAASIPPIPEVGEVPKAPEVQKAPPVTVVPEPPALPRQNARRNQYAASALLLVAAAFLGYWLLKPSRQGLALSASDTGSELRIAWDRTSSSITHAAGGSLDIDDHGLRTQVKLTQADLRSGSVFYARQSGDVAVRMTVDLPGNAPIAEMTRFLRPVAPAPAVNKAVGQASRAVEQPAPPRPAPVVTRHIIPFRAPTAPAKQTSATIPAIAPPKIDNLSPPPQSNAIASVLGAPALPSAPAPPRPKATAPSASGPQASSGRIIWTGKLPKNGRLVVEANRPSSGALSGALPAAAVHVSAFPGDLTAAGMTLFTADPRYAKPLTEAAGAGNGWNPTTYTWDPKRAAGIKIVEQPNPQNGYKLVLESDAGKLSVVVLEWRAAQ